MSKGKEQESLVDFDWEENIDFFGIENTGDESPETISTEPEKESEEDVEEESSEPNKNKPSEEDEPIDFFDTSEEEEPKGEGNPQDPQSTSLYTDLYKDLKETGVFKHIELEEDEDLTIERFLEIQEEEYEQEIESRLEKFVSETLNEDARAMIKFIRDGGSTKEFFETYKEATGIPEGDLEDESYQDSIIRHQLEQEGWDNDEITDRIEFLTESGRKAKVAAKYEEKVQEDREQAKKDLIKKQEQAKKQAKLQEEEYKQSVQEALDSASNIKGITISDKDKPKLFEFLTKKNFKTPTGQNITGFQKNLAEVFKDKEKTVLLAKLLESDFDMSSIEKATTTKQTRKIKSNIETRKSLRPEGSGSSSSGRSLADFF